MINLHEGNLQQELMSEEEFDREFDNMVESLLISKKSIKKFSKKKFIDGEGLEKEEIKMENNIFLTENTNIFLEKAEFSIFPRFKTMYGKYPELKKASSVVKEAEVLLAKTGNKLDNKTDALKCLQVALRILGVLTSLTSTVLIPFMIFIVPIFKMLFFRGFKYVIEVSDFRLAKEQCRLTIKKLNEVKAETDDKKVKKQCDDLIEKINEAMSGLNEDSNEFEGNVFLNESNIFLD